MLTANSKHFTETQANYKGIDDGVRGIRCQKYGYLWLRESHTPWSERLCHKEESSTSGLPLKQD